MKIDEIGATTITGKLSVKGGYSAYHQMTHATLALGL